MVDPWESHWVELDYLYAAFTQFSEVFLQQRFVVAIVAEAIEERTHLHTLGYFVGEKVEQQVAYGVVAEIEVFEVYAALCLTYGSKHVFKLFMPTCQ